MASFVFALSLEEKEINLSDCYRNVGPPQSNTGKSGKAG